MAIEAIRLRGSDKLTVPSAILSKSLCLTTERQKLDGRIDASC
jgi:hypothetical protein